MHRDTIVQSVTMQAKQYLNENSIISARGNQLLFLLHPSNLRRKNSASFKEAFQNEH